MNKKEKKEIENIRKRMYEIFEETGHPAIMYACFSDVTQKLWILSHKRSKTEKYIYKLKSLFKK